ncbi:mechanosensitive ion channel family protein [Frigoriflavimonas asaccharolytica]|uniref:Small-conductance mechanosensitive channel n=1 Tax=Frigoriflavimonas asaccharolytica TaxID=2735899 RepID=A0A8J8G4Y9_9FLAO|nr:mechanosensitive ion channel domain-containing protein [Frigoriflavimonas asaccharolytica]NRS91161.1 small-conductance mechanosensitive channel [Frigoriflavimonas asaccharolytica]
MDENVQKISDKVSPSLRDFLEYDIFSLGKYTLSVYEILAAILVLVLGVYISKIVKKLIYKSNKIDVGKKFAFSQIFHYAIIIISFFLMMKSLGVNISPLLLGSGALLVGVGLGLQSLFLDFISGVIILFDQTVKVGDIVDIDDNIGEVQEIRMRTSTILTRDNKSMIFPNSLLTKEKLINFSHHDNIVRFQVSVGVHYDSDVELVEKLMINATKNHPDIFQSREPFVWLEDFGESSLDFTIYYYSRNLFSAPRIRNDVRKAILKNFRENGVNIPYPMRTVQFPQNNKT